MSTIFEHKQRRVIPNFRNLIKTVELGELDANERKMHSLSKVDLQNYFNDFCENKSVGTAGDLISACIANNIYDNKIIKEAANFVLINSQKASKIQIDFAQKILNISVEKIKPNIDTIDEFLELSNQPLIYDRIKAIKLHNQHFEYNPFLYCELSRLYSIIGQKESAIKNIKIAKNIAPNNRYVLRSFARLMSHYDDFDIAHDVLRKNTITKYDPWLLASEIAFASLRDKTSNLIKFGNEMIASNNFSPFSISELASSLGSVELINGKRKRSRELFVSALRKPNDNALAQVEWINNKENFFDLDIKQYRVQQDFEALTLESYNKKDWHKTIEQAEKWFIDMPFATRPLMYGHDAASFYLQDYDTGIKFCKVGLISNPYDPLLLNNLAFSLAMGNKPTEAFEYLNKANAVNEINEQTRICLLATKGLVYFRSKNIEQGRNFYLQAMEYAQKKNYPYYYYMALLNLAREEALVHPDMAKNFYERISKIDEKDDEKLKFMKNQISEQLLRLTM